MEQNKHNAYGCPLLNQTGAQGIRDFDRIVARLSPDQRAAFEAEREERRAEYERHVERHGYRA